MSGLWSKKFLVKLMITFIKEFQLIHDRTCNLKLESTLMVPGGWVNGILHVWFVQTHPVEEDYFALANSTSAWDLSYCIFPGIDLLLSYLIMKIVVTKKKKSPFFAYNEWHRRNGRFCLKWHHKLWMFCCQLFMILSLINLCFPNIFDWCVSIIRIYQPVFKIPFIWSKCKSWCFEKHTLGISSRVYFKKKENTIKPEKCLKSSTDPFFSVIINMLLTLRH